LPSPGRITSLRTPAGPYVRDDSGVYAGAEISTYYDPMISKLIAWGETRAVAIERMARALDEYRVGGIKTNLPFHRRVMRNAAFRAGDYDTGFIEREKAELCAPLDGESDLLDDALVAAAIHAASAAPAPPPDVAAVPGISAWRRDAWRR
jgi:acetyl-CoA carboxylase biotin carboxylase subunit